MNSLIISIITPTIPFKSFVDLGSIFNSLIYYLNLLLRSLITKQMNLYFISYFQFRLNYTYSHFN